MRTRQGDGAPLFVSLGWSLLWRTRNDQTVESTTVIEIGDAADLDDTHAPNPFEHCAGMSREQSTRALVQGQTARATVPVLHERAL